MRIVLVLLVLMASPAFAGQRHDRGYHRPPHPYWHHPRRDYEPHPGLGGFLGGILGGWLAQKMTPPPQDEEQ